MSYNFTNNQLSQTNTSNKLPLNNESFHSDISIINNPDIPRDEEMNYNYNFPNYVIPNTVPNVNTHRTAYYIPNSLALTQIPQTSQIAPTPLYNPFYAYQQQ
jgi:hypothetical protein